MHLPTPRFVRAALAGLFLAASAGMPLSPGHAKKAPVAKKPSPPAVLVAQGRIRAMAPVPRPGSVPYKDAVVGIRLTGVKALRGGKLPGGDVLLYVWGMRDNKLMPAARYRTGQVLTLALKRWETVEGKYGGYNRSDLDDESVFALPTYWGDAVPAARK